jgi:hypothetical protein
MIHSAKNDLFICNLPLNFIPLEIQNKYYDYINRLPNPIKNVNDFVSATIQGINLPVPFQMEEPSQNQKGIETSFRSSAPWQALPEKTFSITFKLVEGYVNWFILKETFEWFYDFKNRSKFHLDLIVYTTDFEGNIIMQVIFKQVLIKSIGNLTLNYSDNLQQFKTFDLECKYNQIETNLVFD